MSQITTLIIFLYLLDCYGSIPRLPGRPQQGPPRIVGGVQVGIEHHPHHVALQFFSVYVCGGSIISLKWVVTAAHCISTVEPNYFSIRAGSRHRYKGKLYNVSRIIVHPEYSVYSNDYDIAVLRIKGYFRFSRKVYPIRLAKTKLRKGQAVNVTGWGTLMNGGRETNYLRVVTVRVVNFWRCKRAYRNVATVTQRMVCAGRYGIGGKDSCQGDSGGPLTANGTLFGIVSWGYGCAEPKYPGVYTKIAYMRRWIYSNIKYNHNVVI